MALGLVAFVAATVAHFFREALWWVSQAWVGEDGSLELARRANPFLLATAIAVTLLISRALGRWAQRWRSERLGLAAVAAAVQRGGPGPSVAGTALRSLGTWLSSASATSIGRESAILELGASLGSATDRALGRRGGLLATTGITAAFAAAYHAPIAALMYVEQHVRVGRDWRSVLHAVGGAGLGFVVAAKVWGASAVLPHGGSPWSWRVVGLSAAALAPAFLASALFTISREGLIRRVGARAGSWTLPVVLAVVAGVLVAALPLLAGNGLETLRHAPAELTVAMGLTLCFGKLAATVSALGTGAPGGAVSPSLSIAAGAGLLTLLALQWAGWSAGTQTWTVLSIVMAAGIAVGVRAPLMAVFMVPEMAGNYRLVPFSALVAGLCWVATIPLVRRPSMPGPEVHDDDG